MMKNVIFSLGLFVGLTNISYGFMEQATIIKTPMDKKEKVLTKNDSLEEALKEASSSIFTSRFRWGYSFGIGYQGARDSEAKAPIQGILFEGGLYTLFNPIRNYFDIELGINGKYSTGLEDRHYDREEDKEYHAGLKQATIYSGIVFRYDEGRHGISFGISKSLYAKEYETDDMKENNIETKDLENGLGAYIEYQYMSKGRNIGFTRLEIEEFDIKSNGVNEKEKIISFLIGMKL
jgi:hypothetical protein